MKNVKKYLVICTVFLIAAMSTTAFAGTYDTEENNVNLNGTGYKTVLITNNNTDEIVYVNQAADSFEASANFLLKENPTAGFYTLMLGGTDDILIEKFFIGSVDDATKEENGAIELTKKFDAVKETDGTYTLAFATESAEDLTGIRSIILKIDEKCLVKEMTTTVMGEALFGVKITGVSDTDIDKATSVYLSPVAFEGGTEQ